MGHRLVHDWVELVSRFGCDPMVGHELVRGVQAGPVATGRVLSAHHSDQEPG